MKIGDPKKARILVVAAIGAIAFLVIQLLPAKSGQNPVAQVVQSVKGAITGVTPSPALELDRLPISLTVDGFSHLRLAALKGTVKLDSDTTLEGSERSPVRNLSEPRSPGGSGTNESVKPFAITPLPGTPVGTQTEVAPLPDPRGTPSTEPTQEGRQQDKDANPAILLTGILDADEKRAYFSDSSRGSQPFGVGDTLRGFHVKRIDQESVVLSKNGKETTVYVGEVVKFD